MLSRPEEAPPDPGLYAVLGIGSSATDEEIQRAYRRRAAQLAQSDGDITALRQLNAAYEVIGNPVRRAEYDQARLAQRGPPAPPPPIARGSKAVTKVTRRHRPRYAVQSRTGGLADVLAVLLVVALAAAAFTFLIPRLSINLSGLNQLSGILPVLSPRRPVVEPTAAPVATPSATRAPTATPAPTPAPADRWAGSTVSVSQASPAQNTPETIVIKLRRDGQPAANVDVFATVDYRTTQERWPATGTVKTDSAGSAAITFNVGQATPGFQVQVHVFAQLDDQPQSWSTSFTPR